MDEVLEKFEATSVGDDSGDKGFQELYKNWGRLGNQEERRRELLEIQKNDRQNKLDKFRGILEIVQRNEESDFFNSDKRAHYTPRTYVAGFNRRPRYHDVLMLSEWMIEKPEDFHDNWYITPCPKGKRVLVVASYGTTKLFTKCGRFVTQVRTGLPGGNPSSKRQACTVIDCFYDDKLQTLHVLDLLAWNNQPMTDCDTEFRQFWLKSQFAELSQIKVLNKLNRIRFHLLPMVPCTPESLNTFMMTYPHFKDFQPALDGLLLYHKKAHYASGETPLVGWLFPFMVPEVLGSDITVNPQYIEETPKDYVDQATYIKKFEEKYSKKNRGRSRTSSMDTSNSSLDKSDSGKKEGDEMDAEESVKEGTDTMESESVPVETIEKDEPKIKNETSIKDAEDSKDSMETIEKDEPKIKNETSKKDAEDSKDSMEAEESTKIFRFG